MLTVLMPVYNAERHLKAAIESILDQTFTDFEFLIVDDASTDDSAAIAQSYRDPRVRYTRNDRNSGISQSLNRGLALAQGNLIARMDADDISYPHRLARQVEYMDAHPECSLVSAYAREISEDGRVLAEYRVHEDFYYYHLTFGNLVYHPTVLYRKEAIMNLGAYSCFFCEDYVLWCRLVRKYRIATIPEVLLDYRVSDTSLSREMYSEEYDAGERGQVWENVRYFMGESYRLPNAYLECYRHNVGPIMDGEGVGGVAAALGELKRISERILAVPNVNRNDPAIRRAAKRKRLIILELVMARASFSQKIALVLRLQAIDFVWRAAKRWCRKRCGEAFPLSWAPTRGGTQAENRIIQESKDEAERDHSLL